MKFKRIKWKQVLIITGIAFALLYVLYGDFQSSINDFIGDRISDTVQDQGDTINNIYNEVVFDEQGPGAIAESDGALNAARSSGENLYEYRCNIRIGNEGFSMNPFANSYEPTIKDFACSRTLNNQCTNAAMSGSELPAGSYLSWKRTHFYKIHDDRANTDVYAKSFTPSFLYVIGLGLFDYRKPNVEFCATASNPDARLIIDGATHPSKEATVI